MAVQQSFEGPFAGKALLIFPEAHSLELVRSIVGEEHSLEDVIDLEEEALAETGNVILNACLATIANVLHRTMRMSLPAVVRGNGDMLFGVGADIPRGNLVLFLYIDFAIKDRDIHGFIALVMDLPSIVALKPSCTTSSMRSEDKLPAMLDKIDFAAMSRLRRGRHRHRCARSAAMHRRLERVDCPVSGYAKADVLGRTLVELFPALLDTRLPAVVEDAFHAGSASVLTYSSTGCCRCAATTARNCLHNIIVPPTTSGATTYCLLQINDVTISERGSASCASVRMRATTRRRFLRTQSLRRALIGRSSG